MPKSFEEKLDLYAKLAVTHGVNIQPGQELILTADIADAHLTRKIVAAAYEAGAKNVAVMYVDDTNTLTRLVKGSDEAIAYAPAWQFDSIARAFSENAARMVMTSSDPSLLRSVNPDRVATSSKAQAIASQEASSYISAFKVNWNIVGAARPEWASQVFPDDPCEVAVAKLWEAIFSVSKILEDDPLAAWEAHCNELEKRQNWLNGLGLESVSFLGAGTDFKVGLAEGAVWMGGWGYAKNGVRCTPNIPTEEVFTMPHRDRVDGVVRSTKPLSVRGHLVDGIEMTFKAGKVVSAKAEKGEDTLLKLLDTDEGARHLGELALVPVSSGVSRCNVLFYNTLYDENASCHIALGRSYGENMKGSESMSKEELTAKGSNDSLIHVDWMIGSAEVDVTGHLADGTTVPLLRQGEWATTL